MHFYDDPEPGRGSRQLRPVIRAELSLRDQLELKESGSRVGDAQRQRAQDHLNEMYASGHLPYEETEKRREMISAAQREQLSMILDDLPSYTVPATPRRIDWDNDKQFIPLMVAGVIIGVLLAALPVTCLEAANDGGGAGSEAVIVITVVLGVVLALVSAITLVAKKLD